MVHEKVCADLCAWMEVHAGAAVCPFGHNARNERDIFEIKLMSQALNSDGLDEWIRHDDFFLAERSRVTVVSGFSVGGEKVAQTRKAFEEFQRERAGAGAKILLDQLGRRIVLEAF